MLAIRKKSFFLKQISTLCIEVMFERLMICCFVALVVLFVIRNCDLSSESLTAKETDHFVLSPEFRATAKRAAQSETNKWLSYRDNMEHTIRNEITIISDSVNKLFASLNKLNAVNKPVYQSLSMHIQRCHDLLKQAHLNPGDCTILDNLDDHAQHATEHLRELGLLLTPGTELYRIWETGSEQFYVLIRAVRNSARRRCDTRAIGPELNASMRPSEVHAMLEVGYPRSYNDETLQWL